MGINKNATKKRIVWSCISAFWLLFIFGQSLLPAKTSGAESGRIVAFLNNIIDYFGFDFSFTGYFIRKFAHFFEFAILGFVVYFTLNQYIVSRLKCILFTPLVYITVAVSDECLQLISAGRACSVFDMLLDIFGATVGFAISIFIFYFIVSHRERKNIYGCKNK